MTGIVLLSLITSSIMYCMKAPQVITITIKVLIASLILCVYACVCAIKNHIHKCVGYYECSPLNIYSLSHTHKPEPVPLMVADDDYNYGRSDNPYICYIEPGGHGV